MKNVSACLLVLAIGIEISLAPVVAQESKPAAAPPKYAGPQGEQGFLLPNGWRLTPVGEQVPVTDLPLNIVVTPDGKHALVATSGYNAHELTVVDLETREKVTKQTAKQTWFGLTMDAADGRIWWSGGGGSELHRFSWREGKLEPQGTYPAPLAKDEKPPKDAPPTGFRTGICLDSKTGSLFSLTIIPKGGNKSFAWGNASTDGGYR